MSLTAFQQRIMRGIEMSPDFDQWCVNPRILGSEAVGVHTKGTKLFTYYTKDGRLHAERIGQSRILCQITFPDDTEE